MTNTATARPYSTSDRERLISIFDLNVPKYFDPAEKYDLVKFLDHERQHFFVCESEGEIVGCMGYAIEDKQAKISWAFMHPEYHGRGIGIMIGKYIIDQIKHGNCTKIVVRTSQLAYRFFGKLGFTTEYEKKDYWGPGLDLVFMSMEL